MKQGLILIFILAVLTLIIVILKPQMHNEVKIVNTEFAFFNTKEQPQKTTARETTKIKTVEQKTSKNNVSLKPQVQTTSQKNTVKPVTSASQPVKTKVSTTANASSQKTTVVNKSQTASQKVTTTKTPQKQSSTTAAAKQTAQTQKPVSAQKPAASQTQQEQETISWNKWRANVHNSIIAQVNLPSVPAGTVFSYSFTVSSDGVITNVRTSSTAPQYTAYAIQYIAPVIRRSAHASFLTFPAGTSRTSVNVEYKFRTTNSGAGSQASASNFNDVETINK